ncbi:hypothetical protein K402DRAFT_398486 [Aulographum hederae CBS 113979]|uniref:Uncharacterized protein n=1 Tax=Aulographum hederae CBS 113979 TaxID=1176131 RepID=A0A6G1GKP3_9PEZI|nr:hypothetical protein K402DRAFT_398486 [Aulographum hederae CBS 113979]
MVRVHVDTSYPYQSQNTSFDDWISLITLCLAPLIAHLYGGVPTITHLCGTRPRWHDRITRYNPTSIIWRYFAITDRRLRTISWTTQDLAATNALFWTAVGWHGGQETVQKSRTHRIPGHSRTHIEIMSVSTLKTVVVTLQGVQAVYSLVNDATGKGTFGNYLALDTIFFPIAVFGLLRLPAAIWLSDETLYQSSDLSRTASRKEFIPLLDRARMTDSEPLDLSEEAVQSRYRKPWCWGGLLVRVFWILSIAGLSIIAILQMPLGSPAVGGIALTLTALNGWCQISPGWSRGSLANRSVCEQCLQY